MDLKHFEEQIFFATARIAATNEGIDGCCTGTGFFVASPTPDSRSVVILVTCKHVLFGGRGHITLHLHRRSTGAASGPALENPIVIGPATYQKAYHEHPNSEIDIAAINLSTVFEKQPDLFHKHIGADTFSGFSEPDLLPGLRVTFLGYPGEAFDKKHNLPVLRSGYVASLPKVDFDGAPEFLIDAQVFPGSSGSPVFAVLGGKWRFLGVVGKTFRRFNPLEFPVTAVAPTSEEVIGLGVVYKAKAVSDVLESVASKFV